MNRKLVLISNPGIKGSKEYHQLTESIILRYYNFFQSSIGGNWNNNEIAVFREGNTVAKQKMYEIMTYLDGKDVDYSMIVFCGHGGSSTEGEDGIQLPLPGLSGLNVFPVSRLISQNEPESTRRRIKRTVILDACRTCTQLTAQKLFESQTEMELKHLKAKDCQQLYDKIIQKSQPHIELLQSTSPGCYAYGTFTGSQYADEVFKVTASKPTNWLTEADKSPKGSFFYSMRSLHNDVCKGITKAYKQQTPQITIIGDGSLSFPFAAIKKGNNGKLFE